MDNPKCELIREIALNMHIYTSVSYNGNDLDFSKPREFWHRELAKFWLYSEYSPTKQTERKPFVPPCDRLAWAAVGIMLSDRITGPVSLATVREYVCISWKFGNNPLPALRKKLKQWGWTCTCRCWATDPLEEGEVEDKQIPRVSCGASTVYFHPITGWRKS